MNLHWGDGRYEDTARQLTLAAERAVERAGIVPGERVLDVGCGTGNAALIAARRVAEVTGVDPAPRLLEVARERAAEERLEIVFSRGEAAALGLPDDRFDAALAVFSIIFAPDPEAAVADVVRAVRPGGRVVVTSWIAEGPIHTSARLLIDAMRAEAEPPSPWGQLDSLRALFERHRAEVDVTEETLMIEASSPEGWLEAQEAQHPFWRAARRTFTDRPDEYAELRRRSLELLRDENEDPSAFRTTCRYRLVRADLPARRV